MALLRRNFSFERSIILLFGTSLGDCRLLVVGYALSVEIDIAIAQGYHAEAGVGAEHVDLAAVGDEGRLIADHTVSGDQRDIDADDHVIGICLLYTSDAADE